MRAWWFIACGLLLAARAGADPMSELGRRLAEFYRDYPVEKIAPAESSAGDFLNARLKQLGPILSVEERAAIRQSYYRMRTEITPTKLNGAYVPQSRELGNQTSLVQVPDELRDTALHHAIKLHELEHLIQHELAKKWGLGAAYNKAMDRAKITDPSAVFLAEYGAMGVEGHFLSRLSSEDRAALRARVAKLSRLDANSRRLVAQMLASPLRTPDDYRVFQWHRGRYGWDKLATKTFAMPTELPQMLPITRRAYRLGPAALACAHVFRGVLGLFGNE